MQSQWVSAAGGCRRAPAPSAAHRSARLATHSGPARLTPVSIGASSGCTQRNGSPQGRRAGLLVAAAAGGGDTSGSSSDSDGESSGLKQLKLQLRLLGTLMVRFPALIGSAAVAAGFFLHIDALGNFHWNEGDAVLGLQCALPILLIDAALMLPDYSPGTATKTIKLKVPRSVAEKMKEMEAEKEAKKAAEAGGQPAAAAPEPPRAVVARAEWVEVDEEEPPASSSSSSSAAPTQPQGEQQAAAGAADAAAPGAKTVGSLQLTTRVADGADQVEAAAAAAEQAVAAAAAQGGDVVVMQAAAPAGGAAEGAAPSLGAGDEIVEVEKHVTVRADQHPFVAALYRFQMERAVDNVGRLLAFPLELVLILTWHLAEEMLYRAIVLTWAAGWTIDRLYEAGADETVTLLGQQLATPQAGAVLAAVGCTAVSLAILVQRALFPVKLIQQAEQELDAAEGREAERAARRAPFGLAGSSLGAKDAKEKRRMRKVLEKVKTGLVRQRTYGTAIEGTRDVVEWASYSASFLLTGNLLAPWVTAVAADIVYSGWQRLKQRQLDAAQLRSQDQIRQLMEVATLSQQAKKKALQAPAVPPAAGAAEAGGKEEPGANGASTGSTGSSDSNGAASGSEESSSSSSAAAAAASSSSSKREGEE